MAITVLKAADHVRMPWKNGGGETTEIAIHPEGSDLSDFGWRVSMATVAADGPFSVFPGIDRTLAVLSRDGVSLEIEGLGAHLLTPESAPLAFAADAPTTARLVGGAVTDINVMTRRGEFAHRLVRDALAAPASQGAIPRWRLVVALEPLSLTVDDDPVSLARFDVLLCEDTEACISLPANAAHYLIEIDRI